MTPDTDAGSAARPGRRRDPSRDADILEAALEVLAEEGYDGMTVDMVAARARAGKATVYRRWPSKEELVIEAVACMRGGPASLDELPDTGSLRGDLLALIRPPSIRDGERKLQIMTGMASLVARNPGFADAARAAIFEPRLAVHRALLLRAQERGEIDMDADVNVLARVIPAMAAQRTLFEQRPVDREYLVGVIDSVVLPAAGVRAQVKDESSQRSRIEEAG